jgi:GxxExxY protein
MSYTDDRYKYSDLTSRIIGCAMEVHKTLGNGFHGPPKREVVYQRALAIEFELQKLGFARELEMPLFYKGKGVGTRRADFLVEDKVLVEIKAVIHLEDVHLAQAINYLEAYKLEVGLLINFGSKSLQFKRVMKSHNHSQSANQSNQSSRQ